MLARREGDVLTRREGDALARREGDVSARGEGNGLACREGSGSTHRIFTFMIFIQTLNGTNMRPQLFLHYSTD